MKTSLYTILGRRLINSVFCLLLPFLTLSAGGQILSNGAATTAHHSKQVIGYVPQYDAWKASSYGLSQAGVFNQLNLDYRKYTILNFSFFGVANDGSLHSADLRNQQIYQAGTVQAPGQLLLTDVYSSWDYWILFGEITPTWSISAEASAQGYSASGAGWKHVGQGIPETAFPIPLHNTTGPKGLIQLCHDNGVKCMASIGGWSMSKHFGQMAADPVMKGRFLADCQRVINLGFDGIDIDWEYPGPYSGMNFTGTPADYAAFASLMESIRGVIGPSRLLTAAFAAQPDKLSGFNWASLSASMNYFNIMAYDYHGGWNNTAGHNSPLYPWAGQEGGAASWNNTLTALAGMGVPLNKVNMGMAFYGRGVETTGAGARNAPLKKTLRNLQPDGPLETAADYVNWSAAEGSPYYMHLVNHLSGWTQNWDNEAKVPFLTRSGAFLSYDNDHSIGLKAKYIRDHDLAGTIIWTAFGDVQPGPIDSGSSKLPRSSTTQTPLVDALNSVLSGAAVPGETSPFLAIASTNASESSGSMTFAVTLSAAAPSSVSVNYATSNGTATAGSDYTAASGTVTFTAGQTRKTISIPILGDTTSEPTETFVLSLTNPSGAPLAVSSATGAIVDNDIGGGAGAAPPRGLSTWPTNRPITMGYLNAIRSSAGLLQTLTPAQIPTEIAGLHWGGYDVVVHAFAEPKTDGTLGETLGNFKAYQSALIAEAHSRNKAVLLSIGGANPQRLATQFATIAANPTLRSDFVAYVVNYLKLHHYDGVDIDWEFPDVATGRANLNLLMAALYAAVKAENSDYVVMFGTGPGYYLGSYDFATLKDHSDFFFYFGYDWKSPENGPISKPGSVVQWTTADDTMAEQSVRGGINYVLGKGYPASKMICGLPFYGSADTSWSAVRNIYAANQAAYDAAINSNSLEVQINGEWFTTPTAMKRKMDALLKPASSVLASNVVLRGVGTWEIGHEHRSNPDLATAFEQWVAANPGTSALPSFAIAGGAITEGNSGSASLNFTVTLSAPASTNVTVNYATSNGSATSGSDYTATSGTLTFTAGQTSKTIAVPVLGDAVDESNETFSVTLSSPSGATLATATATGTITDDDPPANGGGVTESGNSTWTRHYSVSSTGAFTVQFSQPTGVWSSGFSGVDITLTNNGPATTTWSLAFDAAWGQSGFWNAGTWTTTAGRHTMTQPAWQGYSLATGQSIVIGFNGAGVFSAPANITVNGLALGGSNPGSPNVRLADWLALKGLTSAQQNLDADKDGVATIIEFLQGSDPTSAASRFPVLTASVMPLTVNGVTNQYFTATISADKLAEGVEYRLESSTNLSSWTAGSDQVLLHETTTQNNRASALWRSATPMTGKTRHYFRLAAREATSN